MTPVPESSSMRKKGTHIEAGEPIFTIYAERKWHLDKAIEEGTEADARCCRGNAP